MNPEQVAFALLIVAAILLIVIILNGLLEQRAAGHAVDTYTPPDPPEPPKDLGTVEKDYYIEKILIKGKLFPLEVAKWTDASMFTNYAFVKTAAGDVEMRGYDDSRNRIDTILFKKTADPNVFENLSVDTTNGSSVLYTLTLNKDLVVVSIDNQSFYYFRMM